MAGYPDDSAFEAWLTENGYSLPVGAPSLAVLRQRGSAYIDGTYGGRFPGQPTGGAAQDRAWPRSGASDGFGNSIASDAIPAAVVQASYMAGYLEAVTPGSLSAVVNPGQRVKRQKVDVIEREFFEPGAEGAVAPTSTIIEGMLGAYLINGGEPAVLVV